jgi:hypothetical protein
LECTSNCGTWYQAVSGDAFEQFTTADFRAVAAVGGPLT